MLSVPRVHGHKCLDDDSLDFVINRFFMKLFCTNVMGTVKICQDYFNFELPSSIIEKKRKTFVALRSVLVKLVKI